MRLPVVRNLLMLFLVFTAAVSAQDWSFPIPNTSGSETTGTSQNQNQLQRPSEPQQISNQQQPPNQQSPDLIQPNLNPANGPGFINTVPCPCKFLPNYNPVCGSNGISYANKQVLDCHRNCGVDVTLKKNGLCTRRT